MQRALIQEWPATPGTKGICLTTLSVFSCSSTRYTAYANVDGTAFQLHMSVHLAVIWAVLLITMPRFVGILCVIVHVALRMLAFRYNLVKKIIRRFQNGILSFSPSLYIHNNVQSN